MEEKFRVAMAKVNTPFDFIARPIAFIIFVLIIIVLIIAVYNPIKSALQKLRN